MAIEPHSLEAHLVVAPSISPPLPRRTRLGFHAAPIVVPWAVLVIAGLLYQAVILCRFVPQDTAATCRVGNPGYEFPIRDAASDLIARLNWEAASLVSIILGLVTSAICLVIIGLGAEDKRPLVPAMRRAGAATVAAMTLAAVTWLYIAATPLPLNTWLLDSTLPASLQSTALIPFRLTLYSFVGTLLALATSVLCTDPDGTTLEHQAEALHRCMARLNIVLYAAALTLIAYTVELASLYRWAQEYAEAGRSVTEAVSLYAPAQPSADTVKSLVAALTLTMGTLFSLELAGSFVPAALIQQFHARRLAAFAEPGSTLAVSAKREAWLAARGIGTSVVDRLKRVIAIVSPLLASSPLARLLATFGS